MEDAGREHLIRAGKLDEAAHELLVRYPEVRDGYYRPPGMVYEARGDNS